MPVIKRRRDRKMRKLQRKLQGNNFGEKQHGYRKNRNSTKFIFGWK